LVGTAGFEPATPCPPGRCATKLRYAPTRPLMQFNENLKRGGILLESLPFWKYLRRIFKQDMELNQVFATIGRAD
jgi:hypothetical protein